MFYVLVGCSLLLAAGCKDAAITDNDLLTNDDDLNLAKDTLEIKTLSQFEQPVTANGIIVGVLGSTQDYAFGNCFAGLYAQCRLTSNNVNFGTNPILDSAVLSLAYISKYGDFDIPVNVQVYELAENLVDSVTYKTNHAFSVNATAIGSINGFTPKLSDSISIYGLTYPAHLRVPLTSTFGNKILLSDTANLASNSAFLNYFKGFYITTASSTVGNGIVYLGTGSALSKLTLYYRNDTGDSLTYDIPVSGVRVNHFDHVYTGAPVYTSVNNPNSAGENKMYVQAGAGVKGKIYISNLDSLPKKILVNKAELILTQSQDANDTAYLPPLLLDLYRIVNETTDEDSLLEDDGEGHFGGVRVSEMVDGQMRYRYHFNIKKYFQKLVRGEYANKGFYLKAAGANSNAERVVIVNSSTDENYKLTLVVTYTKL